MNRIDLLRGLSDSQLELLRPIFEQFSCPAGTLIFQQGEQAEFIYLLIDGKVDVSYKPYDGLPITVSHVGRDRVFGWSAAVGSETYTASALAVEPVEAFRVQGRRLRRFCREHPEAGREVLERLAAHVSAPGRDAHEQVQAILMKSISDRKME